MPVTLTTGPGTMYVGTTSSATTTTWANWNQAYVTGGTLSFSHSTITIADHQWQSWNTVTEETAEQAAGRERLREQQAALLEEQRRGLRQAAARAEELLLLMLSDEQAASRREHGWFAVRGSQSGSTYRVHDRGIANNVDRLDAEGRREMIFCAHPAGVPAPDVHLAQLLLIATDEAEFLRIANSHRPADWQAAPVIPLRQPAADNPMPAIAA